MAAGHAKAQMNPRGADAQTVFTAVGAGCYVFDLIEMCAVHKFLEITALPSAVRKVYDVYDLPTLIIKVL